MSNVSGIGQNKTYRGSLPPKEPYYYIRASLDLSGQKANNVVLWLNKENNYNYLTQKPNIYHPDPLQYDQYIKIDSNAVIGEVCVSANPNLVFSESDVENDYSNTLAEGVEIVSVARASGEAQLTLSVDPYNDLNLRVGDLIQVSGITNDTNSFNTTVFVPITGFVGAGPTYTTLTYANAGSDILIPLVALGADKLLEGQITLAVGGSFLPYVGLQFWGGPTGNEPGNLTVSELHDGQICYYGAEPSGASYAVLRLGGGSATNTIVSGKVYVVIKVYPKF